MITIEVCAKGSAALFHLRDAPEISKGEQPAYSVDESHLISTKALPNGI